MVFMWLYIGQCISGAAKEWPCWHAQHLSTHAAASLAVWQTRARQLSSPVASTKVYHDFRGPFNLLTALMH